jgi:hypothetical protein
MKYQTRKRLMMAEMEIPAFANNGAVADTDVPPPARNTRNARDRSANRQSPTANEFRLQDLPLLSLKPVFRSIHRWWLKRAENHYLICADVEQQRAREAQMNVAYYQKRAAMARSARM